MSKLQNAKVVGFFSMPSRYLAEHNPDAYNNAMRNMPAGAGTCSHCGTGIMHHVVIEDGDGHRRFIGTTCAEKVGVEPESIRYRMTTEQVEALRARRAAQHDAWLRRQQEAADRLAALIARRRERVGDLVDMLRGLGGDFYASLARQLEVRPLSPCQAEYVAKATSATGRRNKKNAEAFDAVIDACTAED